MATILVQAGHEGKVRNYGSGSTPSFGTSGTPASGDEEYKLTPLVADQVTAILKAAGHTVIREDAFYDKKYSVDIAVSIHFDGSGTPCASGHSLGYPAGVPAGSNKPTADVFRDAYVPWLPDFVNVMKDNFTSALRGYYGYQWTSTAIAEFLIELCELSCPEQSAWAQERIKDGWFGKVIAHALDKAAGGKSVPHPGDWRKPEVPVQDNTELLEAIADLRRDVTAAAAQADLAKSKAAAAQNTATLAQKGAAQAQARADTAHTRLNKLKEV